MSFWENICPHGNGVRSNCIICEHEDGKISDQEYTTILAWTGIIMVSFVVVLSLIALFS
jgi:hypothetical protein